MIAAGLTTALAKINDGKWLFGGLIISVTVLIIAYHETDRFLLQVYNK